MYRPRDHTRGQVKGPVNLTTVRLREIERIIVLRYSSILPATKEADPFLIEVARLLRRNLEVRKGLPTSEEVYDRLATWAERWAHFTPAEHLREITDRTMADPWSATADSLGCSFRLTDKDRSYLRVTTIGSCDVTKEERAVRRKLRKRERDRKRAEQRRREQGMQTRAAYLANSLSTVRPWEAEGISRRTWQRWRKSKLLDDASPSYPIE